MQPKVSESRLHYIKIASMKTLKLFSFLVIAAAMAMLSSCGGKGSSDPGPVVEVDFSWEPTTVYAGFGVQLRPILKNAKSYRWEFTNPQGSSGGDPIENSDPTITFPQPGSWKVKLTAFSEENFKGKSAFKEKTIEVLASKTVVFKSMILYPAFNDTLGLGWDRGATINGVADLENNNTNPDIVVGYVSQQGVVPLHTPATYKNDLPEIKPGETVVINFDVAANLRTFAFTPNAFFSINIYDLEKGKGQSGSDVVHRMASIGTSFFNQQKGTDKKLTRTNSRGQIMYELVFDVLN